MLWKKCGVDAIVGRVGFIDLRYCLCREKFREFFVAINPFKNPKLVDQTYIFAFIYLF